MVSELNVAPLKSTEQPTSEPTIYPTFMPTVPDGITFQSYGDGGTWMHIFSGSTIDDERQTNNICTIQNAHDTSSISYLNNTN